MDDQRCITVWKTYGNKCYVVPGRYYGLVRPSNNYVETSNDNHLTIYWTSQMEGALIVRGRNDYFIYNEPNESIRLVDFQAHADSLMTLIYPPGEQKFFQVRSDAELIYINIDENYALGRFGERIEH